MALELSLGVVLGFSLFVFIVAVFTLGLIVYVIYDRCGCRKSKDAERLIDESMKREPDGASWENPVLEFEEVITEAENNNVKEEKTDIPVDEPRQTFPVPEEIERIPEGQEYDSESSFEEEKDGTAQEEEPVHMVQIEMPVQEEVPVQEEPLVEEEKPVQEEAPVQKEPIKELDFTDNEHIELTTFSASPVYAKIGESHVEKRPSTNVGKLHDRISQFEDASRSSSLVRPSKKDPLDGIQSNVVSSLVTEYEASDSILLGRQMSDSPNDIVGQNKNWSDSLTKESATKNTSSLNRLSHVQENRDSFLDADTGEPLYSVPDRSKKSSRKSNGPSSLITDNPENTTDGANDAVSPGVPPKAPGI